MKRFFSIFLALVFFGGLFGCAPAKRINEKNAEVAQKAVVIIDSYVDGEATIKTAITELKALEKELDLYDDTEGLGVSVDLVYSAMYSAMSEINLKELELKENDDDILKYRNELAELAGVDKR